MLNQNSDFVFYKRIFLIIPILLFSNILSYGQIEVAHVKVKEFKATGLGAFLNFAVPVTEASFATIEGGFLVFRNSDEEEVGMVPVLAGFRYTLNQTGSGFYVEPNLGYTFGYTTIQRYDENGDLIADSEGNILEEKISGFTTGIGVGYLAKPSGKIQFNIGLRYNRSFGDATANLFSFRISHAFSFGRKKS